jgi:RNA polymerase primary sigma factor
MVDLMLPEKKLSPLFRLAIKSGAADAVALHIRRGEAANGRDGSGLTPLMIAAVHGQLEVCARLLESGADPALVSAGGKAADELAIDHGHAALGAFPSDCVRSGWLGRAVHSRDGDSRQLR